MGCKIIVKSLLNSLPFETERIKWLTRLRIYLPISPQKLELHIEGKKVHILFRFHGQSPLHGSEALNFYRSLLDIYDTYPIFSDNESLMTKDSGERRINGACQYLDIWKDNVLSLNDYTQIRKNAYTNKLSTIEKYLQKYEANDATTNDIASIEQTLNEIEKEDLGHYYNGQ